MARRFDFEVTKTYATEQNAIKAVEKIYPDASDNLRYFIMPTKGGRFFPVFVGQSALQAGVQFHFHVTF